jgi:hypothetical protein
LAPEAHLPGFDAIHGRHDRTGRQFLSNRRKMSYLERLRNPWATTMRSRVRRFAHFLERIGLAMAGAASGLFVAAHVGSSIAWFTSQGFVLIMMISGAIGFYLGIDTPPLPFHAEETRSRGGLGKVDSAEFLSAVGTFFAALTAFASVCVIVFRANPHIFWTTMIMLGWVLGVLLQIIAGAIARVRQ